MSESRFSRWSRRKTEARVEQARDPAEVAAEQAKVEAQVVEAEAVKSELEVNEGLSDAEVIEKYALPDPDALELGSDITGFLRQEVPELLRRRALRAFWKTNPVLACLDGLNDYDEDFTDAATAMKGFQTIYKVGEGLVDKSKAKALAAEAEAEAAKIEAESASLDRSPVALAEPESEPDQIEPPNLGATTVEVAPAFPAKTDGVERDEIEGDAAPRYRPRMRFTP